jgi:carboxyl-terminal processing protease
MDTIAASLRGEAGTSVALVVTGTSGVTETVTLRRVDLPSTPVTTDLLAPGVVRIRIATFSAGVAAQVAKAHAAALASGAKAIVLDLRGNPGGLLDEAVDTASVFLDGGTVVDLQGRAVPETTLKAALGGDTRTPLAVLIDGGTASAAEVLTGALADRGRAVVVGSRSFGKGSVQQTTTLSDGSVLELTVATYRTPNGHTVEGVGIAPDVQIDPAASPTVVSDRAVALLQALVGT